MVPSTVVGLVLFVAALAPGYFFLRVAERFETRASRSPFLEAVELIVIGSLATTFAALLALLMGTLFESFFLDVRAWAREGNSYLRTEPFGVARSVAFVVPAACGLAAVGARLVHHDGSPDLVPHATVWRSVFHYHNSPVLVGLQLKDGILVEGYLWSYPTGPSDVREIALQKPIIVTPLRGERGLAPGVDRVIVSADEISHITARYGTDQ